MRGPGIIVQGFILFWAIGESDDPWQQKVRGQFPELGQSHPAKPITLKAVTFRNIQARCHLKHDTGIVRVCSENVTQIGKKIILCSSVVHWQSIVLHWLWYMIEYHKLTGFGLGSRSVPLVSPKAFASLHKKSCYNWNPSLQLSDMFSVLFMTLSSCSSFHKRLCCSCLLPTFYKQCCCTCFFCHTVWTSHIL